jgi:hypothetical protein
VVSHAPDAEEVRAIEARFPGSKIQLHLHEGMRLADLYHRDPYSYELGAIFMGANRRAALLQDFKALFRALDLRFEEEQREVA